MSADAAPPAVGVDVVLPGPPGLGDTPAFAMLPPGATRAVVVIHEIFGWQPEIQRVVERFARAGYAAVAPKLFQAPGFLSCVRETMAALGTGEGAAAERARAFRSWLCAQTGLPPERVGIIGFCFGGGFALAVGRGWGAISTNYGDLPRTVDAARGLGPTIGCYGGRDLLFGRGGAKLESLLRAADVEVESHTFPDVGHSFLTDGDHPWLGLLAAPVLRVTYVPETAEEGWRRILAFFDRHLGAGVPAELPPAPPPGG